MHAAEGGLALARWALGRDGAWRGERIEVGDAQVEVHATPDPDGGFGVVAVGRCWPRGEQGMPVQRRVAARVVPGGGRLRDWRELR